MSHTLHRSGSTESLANDFPMHAMGARGFNRDGCGPRMKHFAEVVLKYPSENAGIVGFPPRLTLSNVDEPKYEDSTMVHIVMNSPEELTKCLKELKEEDIGLSVTVSGVFDLVHQCCIDAGLVPHTVNMSLGVWGATEKYLPKDESVSEISSMCGHGMIPFSLVEDAISKIRKGKMTAEQAAAALTPTCTCHIFNTRRAAELLKKYEPQSE